MSAHVVEILLPCTLTPTATSRRPATLSLRAARDEREKPGVADEQRDLSFRKGWSKSTPTSIVEIDFDDVSRRAGKGH